MIDKVLNGMIDETAKRLDQAKDLLVGANKQLPARAWIGVGAVAGALVAGCLAAFLMRDFGKRNIEYMPDMSYSKAWESQTTHDYLYDYHDKEDPLPAWMVEHGSPDMPPPVGTVYRGQKTLELSANEEGRNLAAAMVSPLAGQTGDDLADTLKRGKNLFRYNCQGCHGVDGVGNAPVTKYGIGAPAIDTSTIRDKWSDGEIFHIITNGYNTMPAHKSHVDYEDRWVVIRYLRELQKGKQ